MRSRIPTEGIPRTRLTHNPYVLQTPMNDNRKARVVPRLVALLVVLTVSLAGLSWLVIAQDSAPAGFTAYPLRHAQAADVAPRLKEMLSQQEGGQEVLVDRQGNRVLVRGGEDIQRLAGQLLQTLDRPAAPRASEPAQKPGVVRSYQVPAGTLEATVARLRNLFPVAGGVRVASDSRTQQVIVVAPEEVQRQVAQALGAPAAAASPPPAAAAAQPPVAEGTEHTLRHISWRELEDGLRRVWGPRLAVTPQAGGEAVTVALQSDQTSQAVLQIDRRRDSVRFLGPPALTRAWSRVVTALDQPRGATEQNAELMPVRRADPQKIRRAVDLLQSGGLEAQTATVLPAGNDRAGSPGWRR